MRVHNLTWMEGKKPKKPSRVGIEPQPSHREPNVLPLDYRGKKNFSPVDLTSEIRGPVPAEPVDRYGPFFSMTSASACSTQLPNSDATEVRIRELLREQTD